MQFGLLDVDGGGWRLCGRRARGEYVLCVSKMLQVVKDGMEGLQKLTLRCIVNVKMWSMALATHLQSEVVMVG